MKPVLLLCCVSLSVFAQQTRLGDAPYLPQTGAKPESSARSASGREAIPSTWYDISTRSASQLAYLNDYLPTTGAGLGFTGNVAAGVAGDTSPAWKQAVLNRVNYFRAMAGVPANVVLDSTLSSSAQAGALMMARQGQISHCRDAQSIDTCIGWPSYTAAASLALSRSNVCQGSLGDAGCIELYMADQGPNNAVVGHRRWILYTRQRQMGTGDVPAAIPGFLPNLWNALYVLDQGTFLPSTPALRDGFVAWPPKGYVPYQLNFPRWSFSVPGADLSAVVLKVKKGSGVFTPITFDPPANGYGDNTIIFNPDARGTNNQDSYVAAVPPADTTYTVSVENVKIGNAVQPAYVYDVVVFDPAVTPSTPCTPSITSYNAQSGYQNVTVQVSGSNCSSWTVASGASWVGISTNAGNGPGSLTLTVYPNFTSGNRTTTATVAGVPVTITQPSVGGTADQRFIGQLYFYMLGRIATPSEISGQLALLPSLGRAGMANSLMNSEEFNLKSRYIAGLYVGLLNRDAEFAGWQFQRNALLQGFVSAPVLVTNFISTAEYLLRYPGQTDEQFVRMLYAQLLLRTPSPSEVTGQMAVLAGWNRSSMASAFMTLSEFRTGTGPRLLAFLFYATLLNRDPTPAELATLVTALTGASEAQRIALLNQIVTSPEYLALIQ